MDGITALVRKIIMFNNDFAPFPSCVRITMAAYNLAANRLLVHLSLTQPASLAWPLFFLLDPLF